MPERQTNLRIDSNEENVWIEHFIQNVDGEEYEDSERITLRLTDNLALDALEFYNELMRVQPKKTIEHLKKDLERLEEVGYDSILDDGSIEEAQRRNGQDTTKEAE